MARVLAVLSLLALGSAACAPSPRPPAAAATPSPAVAATPAPPAPIPPSAPVTLATSGLYHLSGQVDAMNLSLDLDAGTFRVGVDGCDYEHATQGLARATGDGIVLSGGFTWPEGVSFANDVETVLLRAGPDGSLRASGEIGGRRFEQEWLAGGVCPDCEHALGPSGQRACARPYLGR